MRVNLYRAWPEGVRAVGLLHEAVENSGLDHRLLELVKVRASQINGCAYCIDMHTKDARALGESEQRLYALNAWQETTFFSSREAAALALTEAITLVASTHVPDDVVDEARQHFDESEFSQLVFAIVTINTWNRLSLTMRPPVGDYESKRTPE